MTVQPQKALEAALALAITNSPCAPQKQRHFTAEDAEDAEENLCVLCVLCVLCGKMPLLCFIRALLPFKSAASASHAFPNAVGMPSPRAREPKRPPSHATPAH